MIKGDWMNYAYENIHKEFKKYVGQNRTQGTMSVALFCNANGIEHRAHDNLPSRATVYAWYKKTKGK